MSWAEDGRDAGILVLRVGIGVMFILHGFPKLIGGTETWAGLGQAMGTFGIGFAPAFWGFMAALAEFGGGICLIIGLGFRIACALMAFTMLVASAMHLSQGHGIKGAAHAIELLIVFLSLMIIGSGKFSLARKVQVRFLQ